METRRRSFAKAIIWNIIGLTVMVFVGFIATGSYSLGGQIALANSALGLVSYLIYERVWARVKWGRIG